VTPWHELQSRYTFSHVAMDLDCCAGIVTITNPLKRKISEEHGETSESGECLPQYGVNQGLNMLIDVNYEGCSL
jgi:hypothetical protein